MTTPIPPAHSPLVLIIEDEEPIRRFLRATLESRGYKTKESGTAKDGLLQARTQRPDLILLDLGLPDGDGLEVTRQVRMNSAVPIVVLSARGQEADKVAALDAEALTTTSPSPLGSLSSTARIRVALRHASRPAGSVDAIYEAQADGRLLRVDTESRTVSIRDALGKHEVRLTPTEFKLLAFMVRHAGKVLTHQQILKEVWGPTHGSDVQYLRVYAGQLRQKLEASPAQPRFLVTEPGVGYRLTAPGEQPSTK